MSTRLRSARNVLILLFLAFCVWQIPGGEAGSETIGNILTLLFIGGLLFFGYRVYMENRITLVSLGDRLRALLYGSVLVAALTFIATPRLWETPLGALTWFALIGLAGFGVFSVFQTWRAN